MQLEHNLPSPAEKGSGSISPLGHVTGSGLNTTSLAPMVMSVLPPGSPATTSGLNVLGPAGSGSLTLTAKIGKVFVSISEVTLTGKGYAGEYTITGGTKAYAGETGSGNILITYPINGKFTARFS